MDCLDYNADFVIYEISRKAWPEYYANPTIITAKPVQATKHMGIV